ncbi:MAG: hypothetical protein WA702_14455, partial [Bradyrhizobium sp.]
MTFHPGGAGDGRAPDIRRGRDWQGQRARRLRRSGGFGRSVAVWLRCCRLAAQPGPEAAPAAGLGARRELLGEL